MSLSPKSGKLLKDSREKMGLSIQDVHRETKIAVRFLEAMEKENYMVFPAETYLIGFLTQYARFLDLDTEEVVSIYRDDKMDASASPIEDLIQKPKWHRLIFMHVGEYWPKILLALVSVSFLTFGGIFIFSPQFNVRHWWETTFDFGEGKESVSFCHEGEKQVNAITLPSSSSPPKSEFLSLKPPDALRFSLDRLYFKLCIFQIKTDRQSNVKASILHLNINNKENVAFELKERETYILGKNAGLRNQMEHLLKVTPLVIGDFSIRLEFETEENYSDPTRKLFDEPGALGGNPADSREERQSQGAEGVNIQITLRFTEESYLEWVQDGQSYRGRIVNAGEVRTFEARDRLDIKVGNGKGVTLYREGAKPRILGPSGHIVNLNYERVPDPLDPSIYRIRENITVIR